MPSLSAVVSGITTILAFAGCGYYLLVLWSGRSFVRARPYGAPYFYPPVSILKPVKGLDPEMYESFASHCRQDYLNEYEILFAAGGPDDPAIEAIEKLQREFPQRSIRLVLCPETLGANGKVSSLVQALPHARFDHILISDSDISVSPLYLRKIMESFGFPPGFLQRRKRRMGAASASKSDANDRKKVGLVTALYRGKAHGTVASRMEALGISTDFAPNVLTARMLEGGIHFGLGSTLAVSREALEAIGGLMPLADYLADDYQLGARIAAKGFEVVLSREVVETSVPAYAFPEFLAHQLRWARTVRDARPRGYFGIVFTYGLAWASLNVIASGASLESLALLSIAVAARAAVALLVGVELLGDRQVLRDLWLLPARDLIMLGIWAWSYAGTTIHWRGDEFTIKDGKLIRSA